MSNHTPTRGGPPGPTRLDLQRAIVEHICRRANELTPWPDIEKHAHQLGREIGVDAEDVQRLLEQSRRAIVGILRRRLAMGVVGVA